MSRIELEPDLPGGIGRGAIGLALLAVFAAAVRLYGISRRDFWFDESCTFIYVHNLLRWPDLSNLLVESTNLPYYALLWIWTGLAGESELGYRSLSAVSAALTIPALGVAAWRLRGPTAGLLCALLAAFHPLHVYYAQEARAYALWVLLLSTALVLLIEASRRNSARWWAAYGAFLWISLHVHYFTAFLAAVSFIAARLASDQRAALRRWALSVAVVGMAFLPYLVLAVLPAAGGGGSAWIAPSFNPSTAVFESLWAFLPAGGYPGHLRGLSLASPDTVIHQSPLIVLLSQTLPAFIVAASGLALVRRGIQLRAPALRGEGALPASVGLGHRADVSTDAGPVEKQGHTDRSTCRPAGVHGIMAMLTLGPLFLAFAYSVVIRPVYLAGRYDLVAWPAAIVWLSCILDDVAGGQTGRIRHGLLTAITAALVACSLVPLHRLLAFHPPPSFHRVRAEQLAEMSGEGDIVIALSYDRDYLAYYLHRAGFRGTVRPFPVWLERQVGWVETDADLRRLDEAAADARRLADEAAELVAAGGRVFLLGDSIDPDRSGREPIERQLLAALAEAGLRVQVVKRELLVYAVK